MADLKTVEETLSALKKVSKKPEELEKRIDHLIAEKGAVTLLHAEAVIAEVTREVFGSKEVSKLAGQVSGFLMSEHERIKKTINDKVTQRDSYLVDLFKELEKPELDDSGRVPTYSLGGFSDKVQIRRGLENELHHCVMEGFDKKIIMEKTVEWIGSPHANLQRSGYRVLGWLISDTDREERDIGKYEHLFLEGIKSTDERVRKAAFGQLGILVPKENVLHSKSYQALRSLSEDHKDPLSRSAEEILGYIRVPKEESDEASGVVAGKNYSDSIVKPPTPIKKPVLVTLHSLKGGTGKTTTAINLGTLLAEKGKTLVIDMHFENPQYQILLGGPDPEYEWLSYFDMVGHEELGGYNWRTIISEKEDRRSYINTVPLEDFVENISKAIVPAEKTAVFRRGNLHFLYSTHQYDGQFMGSGSQCLTVNQSNPALLQKMKDVLVAALTYGFDYVVVDSDAGGSLERKYLSMEWQLHWCADGYDEEAAKKESFDMFGKDYGVSKSIQPQLDQHKLFKKAHAVVVANSAITEIRQLYEKEDRFRVYGENERHLIINGAEAEIEGLDYGTIVRLPRVRNVGFGNIGCKRLFATVNGRAKEHRAYRSALWELAEKL